MSAYSPAILGCGLPPGRNPFLALVAAATFSVALSGAMVTSDPGRADTPTYAADTVADELRHATATSASPSRGAS